MIYSNLIFPFDYIIVLLVIIISLFSLWKGFIQSILGLLTWIGSVLVTIYAFESFSNFLTKQILNISFFQNYEYLTNIGSIIISIPIIFLIALFFLKRIRKFLSADLDRQILGTFFDKIFGLFYGLIFSYVILTTINILLYRYNFNELSYWLNNNSYIIFEINNFNEKYFYFIFSTENTL